MCNCQHDDGMLIAGIDEVGMGCIAGPVYAAAVVLSKDHGIVGLRDSKTIRSEARRESVAVDIRNRAVLFAVASASVEEIDELNILVASWSAMTRAVALLEPQPSLCLVDGAHAPDLGVARVKAVPGGDRTEEAIMAAAILAKVARDAEMRRLDTLHPGYDFARNKGYGVPAIAALKALGVAPPHRRTFGPVRSLLRDGVTLEAGRQAKRG
jgi:ribonuclease HII